MAKRPLSQEEIMSDEKKRYGAISGVAPFQPGLGGMDADKMQQIQAIEEELDTFTGESDIQEYKDFILSEGFKDIEGVDSPFIQREDKAKRAIFDEKAKPIPILDTDTDEVKVFKGLRNKIIKEGGGVTSPTFFERAAGGNMTAGWVRFLTGAEISDTFSDVDIREDGIEYKGDKLNLSPLQQQIIGEYKERLMGLDIEKGFWDHVAETAVGLSMDLPLLMATGVGASSITSKLLPTALRHLATSTNAFQRLMGRGIQQAINFNILGAPQTVESAVRGHLDDALKNIFVSAGTGILAATTGALGRGASFLPGIKQMLRTNPALREEIGSLFGSAGFGYSSVKLAGGSDEDAIATGLAFMATHFTNPNSYTRYIKEAAKSKQGLNVRVTGFGGWKGTTPTEYHPSYWVEKEGKFHQIDMKDFTETGKITPIEGESLEATKENRMFVIPIHEAPNHIYRTYGTALAFDRWEINAKKIYKQWQNEAKDKKKFNSNAEQIMTVANMVSRATTAETVSKAFGKWKWQGDAQLTNDWIAISNNTKIPYSDVKRMVIENFDGFLRNPAKWGEELERAKAESAISKAQADALEKSMKASEDRIIRDAGKGGEFKVQTAEQRRLTRLDESGQEDKIPSIPGREDRVRRFEIEVGRGDKDIPGEPPSDEGGGPGSGVPPRAQREREFVESDEATFYTGLKEPVPAKIEGDEMVITDRSGKEVARTEKPEPELIKTKSELVSEPITFESAKTEIDQIIETVKKESKDVSHDIGNNPNKVIADILKQEKDKVESPLYKKTIAYLKDKVAKERELLESKVKEEPVKEEIASEEEQKEFIKSLGLKNELSEEEKIIAKHEAAEREAPKPVEKIEAVEKPEEPVKEKGPKVSDDLVDVMNQINDTELPPFKKQQANRLANKLFEMGKTHPEVVNSLNKYYKTELKTTENVKDTGRIDAEFDEAISLGKSDVIQKASMAEGVFTKKEMEDIDNALQNGIDTASEKGYTGHEQDIMERYWAYKTLENSYESTFEKVKEWAEKKGILETEKKIEALDTKVIEEVEAEDYQAEDIKRIVTENAGEIGIDPLKYIVFEGTDRGLPKRKINKTIKDMGLMPGKSKNQIDSKIDNVRYERNKEGMLTYDEYQKYKEWDSKQVRETNEKEESADEIAELIREETEPRVIDEVRPSKEEEVDPGKLKTFTPIEEPGSKSNDTKAARALLKADKIDIDKLDISTIEGERDITKIYRLIEKLDKQGKERVAKEIQKILYDKIGLGDANFEFSLEEISAKEAKFFERNSMDKFHNQSGSMMFDVEKENQPLFDELINSNLPLFNSIKKLAKAFGASVRLSGYPIEIRSLINELANGIHIDLKGSGRRKENMIGLNFFPSEHTLLMSEMRTGRPPEEVYADHLLSTLIHEIAHEEVKTHGETFAKAMRNVMMNMGSKRMSQIHDMIQGEFLTTKNHIGIKNVTRDIRELYRGTVPTEAGERGGQRPGGTDRNIKLSTGKPGISPSLAGEAESKRSRREHKRISESELRRFGGETQWYDANEYAKQDGLLNDSRTRLDFQYEKYTPQDVFSAGAFKNLGKRTRNGVKKVWALGFRPPPYQARIDKKFQPIYRVLQEEYVLKSSRVKEEIMDPFRREFNNMQNNHLEDLKGTLSKMNKYQDNIYDGKHGELTPENFMEMYEVPQNARRFIGMYQEASKAILDAKRDTLKELYTMDDLLFNRLESEYKTFIDRFFPKEGEPENLNIWSADKKTYDRDKANQLLNEDLEFKSRVAELMARGHFQYDDKLYFNSVRPLGLETWKISMEKSSDNPSHQGVPDPDRPGEIIPGSNREEYFSYAETEGSMENIIAQKEAQGFHLTEKPFKIGDALSQEGYWNRLSADELMNLVELAEVDLADPTSKNVVSRILNAVSHGTALQHEINKKYTPGLHWTQQEYERGLERLVGESIESSFRIRAVKEARKMATDWESDLKTRKKSMEREDWKSELDRIKYAKAHINLMSSSDKSIVDGVRGVAATFYTAGKISFFVQQALQGFQTTWHLARGEAKALGGGGDSAFLGATADVFKYYMALNARQHGLDHKINGDIDAGTVDMLHRLQKEGIINAQGIKELTNQQSDSALKYSQGIFRGLKYLHKGLNIPSAAIEKMTRVQSALTFYRLGIQKGLSGEELHRFTYENVDLSMSKWGPSGRPVIGVPSDIGKKQGQITKMLTKSFFTFKTFATHNLGLYEYLYKNKMYGALMSKAAVGAGVHGITKFPLMAMMFGIANMFTDDDAEHEAVKAIDDMNEQIFPWAPRVLTKGFASTVGIDASQLFAEQDIIGDVYAQTRSRSVEGKLAEAMIGAPYGLLTDAIDAAGGIKTRLQALVEGDASVSSEEKKRAIRNSERLFPLFIRNVLHSYDLQKDGVELKGDQLIKREDLSWSDVVYKLFSLQPLRIVDAYEEQFSGIVAKYSRAKGRISEIKRIRKEIASDVELDSSKKTIMLRDSARLFREAQEKIRVIRRTPEYKDALKRRIIKP